MSLWEELSAVKVNVNIYIFFPCFFTLAFLTPTRWGWGWGGLWRCMAMSVSHHQGTSIFSRKDSSCSTKHCELSWLCQRLFSGPQWPAKWEEPMPGPRLKKVWAVKRTPLETPACARPKGTPVPAIPSADKPIPNWWWYRDGARSLKTTLWFFSTKKRHNPNWSKSHKSFFSWAHEL